MLNITNDYEDVINSTDSENDKIDIIISTLFLSIPSGLLFLSSFLSFIIWTLIKPLITNK